MSDFRASLDLQKWRNGATENWYASGSLSSVKANLEALALARNQLLVTAAVLNEGHIRGVSDDVKGQTDYTPLSDISGGALSGQGDVSNVGALVRVFTNQGFQARLYLHGMPDAWCYADATTGKAYLTGDARDALRVYFAKVQALGFGLRGISRADVDATPTKVASFTPVMGTPLTYTISAPGFTAVKGQQIIVTRPKGYLVKQFRGRWVVVTGGTDSFTASKLGPFDTTAVYRPNSATVRHIVMKVDPVSRFLIIRPGTKKMGRIPDATPGRRSAAR